MPNPLAESFRYNRWATLGLIDFCRSLTDKQLDFEAPGTAGTIRECLMHIVGSEQTFLLRTKGRQHEDEIRTHGPWAGFDRLHELAFAANDGLIAAAEGLEGDVQVVLPYQGMRPVFPVSFFLAHALGHSAEHRTQVLMSLAQLGVERPDLDGWAYAQAMGYGATT